MWLALAYQVRPRLSLPCLAQQCMVCSQGCSQRCSMRMSRYVQECRASSVLECCSSCCSRRLLCCGCSPRAFTVVACVFSFQRLPTLLCDPLFFPAMPCRPLGGNRTASTPISGWRTTTPFPRSRSRYGGGMLISCYHHQQQLLEHEIVTYRRTVLQCELQDGMIGTRSITV